MRIAMVTRQYWPAVGGVERVVENLGQAYVLRGHQVTVVAQCVDELHFGRMTHVIRERKIFDAFTHRGMSVVQFRPSRARRSLLLPLAAELIPFGGRITRRWLGRYSSAYYASVVDPVLTPLLRGADIVHMLGSNLLAVGVVRSAHRLGAPVAISPFAHVGEWGDDSGSVSAYLNAEKLLATTRADADAYRSLGVPDDQIEIVGLPVPDALAGLGELPSEPHGEPMAPPAAPVILFLGQRRPTKRYELLLAAAELVWERHPDAHFAFVGPGRALPSERDPRILDVGRVSDQARGWWLQRADLLSLPSVSESFGMVVAEAWSQSLPVLVSDIPVLRELVEESGGGIAAAPDRRSFADAICSLLDDRERCRQMGRAGYEYWARELTPDAVAARHLAIYERLIEERRASASP
jgi:glycosyltransferase involved in cell wall biosynthesis